MTTRKYPLFLSVALLLFLSAAARADENLPALVKRVKPAVVAIATYDATGGGAELVAPPTLTPWHSRNARLEAPGDLQITLYQDEAD